MRLSLLSGKAHYEQVVKPIEDAKQSVWIATANLKELMVEDPRVQLIADMQMRPHRSLVIGKKRSEFPEGAPLDDMARMLLWYLPPQRSVMLMPDDWSLGQMTPLSEPMSQARISR